ncbi:hypothetical protein BCR42DRAFT_430303 [Absidia repens]|uniref:Uncharacterized protein n=1 Tax=Absidia repens TaxID=90262 RepID=A0A1X2HH47_9FUNG|nr:hypothetical protein BCR42DRAFT_430303 [Absidia repens]
MSLMESHSRPSSRQRHSSSLPPITIKPIFPEHPSSPRRHHNYHQHHHHHQGRRHTKHRLSNASATSYSSTKSSSSSLSSSSIMSPRSFNTFELVFTNLIDALIFTSAIAITAYNYWMGYIVDPPRIYDSPTAATVTSSIVSTSSSPKSPSPCMLLKPLDIPSPPLSVTASSPSSPIPAKLEPTWSDLKRTPDQQNVSSSQRLHSQENDAGPPSPTPPEEEEEEEERVNRMEETLQELIRQGQAALTSPVDWEKT